MKTKAKVYIAGAGPFDPGLITIKALNAIKNADVLIYDYLANKEFTKDVKADCEVIYVGKQGGCHTKTQDEINKLIIKKAKQGKVVVRLKGGDPFIFGRGGEEALYCKKHNIDFEIIPGITSAIGAPEYAGIPLTHREFTSTVTFITGHEDPDKNKSNVPWKSLATMKGTLVFLMGMENLEKNNKLLIKFGRNKNDLAAIIQWGTSGKQKVVTGTISNIHKIAKQKNIKAPAIIVIGDVVGLSCELNWFSKKPLLNKTILVTRTRKQASNFSNKLIEEGAHVIEFPTIEVNEIKNNKLIDKIKNIDNYDYLIFTSQNGVDIFFKYFNKYFDSRKLNNKKIITIGSVTAKQLELFGIKADFVPDEFTQEGIVAYFKKQKYSKNTKILIPRAQEARNVLEKELIKIGFKLDIAPVYKVNLPKYKKDDLLKIFNEKIDLITFASSLTVTNFFNILKKNKIDIKKQFKHIKYAVIGPITGKTLKNYGLKIDIIAKKYTINDLVEAIIAYYKRKKS